MRLPHRRRSLLPTRGRGKPKQAQATSDAERVSRDDAVARCMGPIADYLPPRTFSAMLDACEGQPSREAEANATQALSEAEAVLAERRKPTDEGASPP